MGRILRGLWRIFEFIVFGTEFDHEYENYYVIGIWGGDTRSFLEFIFIMLRRLACETVVFYFILMMFIHADPKPPDPAFTLGILISATRFCLGFSYVILQHVGSFLGDAFSADDGGQTPHPTPQPPPPEARTKAIFDKLTGENFFAYTDFKLEHWKSLYKAISSGKSKKMLSDENDLRTAVEGVFEGVILEVAKRQARLETTLLNSTSHEVTNTRDELDGLRKRLETLQKARNDIQKKAFTEATNDETLRLKHVIEELKNRLKKEQDKDEKDKIQSHIDIYSRQLDDILAKIDSL